MEALLQLITWICSLVMIRMLYKSIRPLIEEYSYKAKSEKLEKTVAELKDQLTDYEDLINRLSEIAYNESPLDSFGVHDITKEKLQNAMREHMTTRRQTYTKHK